MRWFALLATVAACSDNAGGGTGPVCTLPEHEPASIPSQPYDLHAYERRTCSEFHAGDTVEKTIGPAARDQFSSQLEHVIVILRENRSFDNMLSGHDTEPITTDWNPDPSGVRTGGELKKVHRFHESHYCTASPNHEWTAVHLQYNNGLLNGFVSASNRNETNQGGCVAMGYYDKSDLKLYDWLANNFAISTHYHASVLGPTIPNLLYYFYASSCGSTDNDQGLGFGCKDSAKSIFKLLSDANVSYAVYSNSTTPSLGAAKRLTDVDDAHVFGMAQYIDDLANNKLPQVVFVEPNYRHLPGWAGGGTQNDEHPPSNIQDGQKFVYDVLSYLMRSDAWMHSVAFITWDEHGGYFDHVQPPDACEPDALAPKDFPFDRLGFRTPFFAVSPFAIPGHKSLHTADHTSILRFIEAWQNLGALTDRDANAWPLLDMFDFSMARTIGASDMDPSLAAKTKDASQTKYCGTDGYSCCYMDPPCSETP